MSECGGVNFTVPDDYRRPPSVGGIDMDGCRHVPVEDRFLRGGLHRRQRLQRPTR
jgi:hypothetical protein